MEKTLYGLLGLSPSASQNDIDAAYHRLKTELDPDAPENKGNTDAEMQLKAVREAYTLLSDPERRGAYDASLAYRVLDLPSPQEKPRWSTNRILIYVLSGLIGFAVINQAVVQWQALRLSKAALEGNDAFREEVAERERAATLGLERDNPEAARERLRQYEEAQKQRQLQYEEEKRQRELKYEEERQKRELEETRRYGARISDEVARSVAEGQRKQEYERQQQEAAQRYEQERRDREAMQRLEAEKRRLRQLEYQNNR